MPGLCRTSFWVLTVPLLLSSSLVSAQNDSVWSFRSRPDLYPPRLRVSVSEDNLSPGYIFMAPYQAVQNSAVIYDDTGELIWSGFGLTGGGSNHDFHVCSVDGNDHLCLFEGAQSVGYARGQATILDSSFSPVTQLRSQNGLANIDLHEFQVLNDDALVIVYNPERFDLSAYNVSSGEGWLQNCLFQRLDIDNGELQYEWSAIDHVALSESYVSPGSSEVAGTGFSAISPWDYFHMNSVDQDSNGDFLVSARHTRTIYKISGEDGHIIWRLGGKLSDFEFEQGLNFSYQHDARWLSTNSSSDVISLFDNASNGADRTASVSSGMILKLDHSVTPPFVSLLSSFPAPTGQALSTSQGNVQLLGAREDWATANAFIGWGSIPTVTEHDSSGKIIYQASLNATGMMNYRAYKFNFVSNPRDSPALYSYALSTNANTSFFMSWNGATEVRRWRIYGRNACDDQWTMLDTINKTGFETLYQANGYHEFGMVEALDTNGYALKNSTSRGVQTFVPSSTLASQCNEEGCQVASSYSQASSGSTAAQMRVGCPAQAANSSSGSSSASSSATTSSGNVARRLLGARYTHLLVVVWSVILLL